jgi:electron transfer flavoprotein beta subunit
MTIIREGVESIINPLDHVALRAALKLRETRGGEVIVITMGPPQSEAALREAVAMGVDRVILLTDPSFAGADTLATSHVLATAISFNKPFPDLILCGMQTVDSDTGHVGPQIAEELNIPQVCGVNEIYPEEDSVVVKRESDGFIDTLRVKLPALLTVTYEAAPTGEISLGALERAFSELPIDKWGKDVLRLSEDEVGLRGSATQVWKLKPPQPHRKGDTLSGQPRDLVAALIQKLEVLSVVDEEK